MSNPTPTPRQALRFLAFLLAVVSTGAIFIMLALGLPPAVSMLLTAAALWLAVGSL